MPVNGTTIGAFASLLPTGQYAPREVPSFGRYGPGGLKGDADIDKLLATADTVMRRRGRELTPALEAVYRAAAAHRGGVTRPTTADVDRVRKTA